MNRSEFAKMLGGNIRAAREQAGVSQRQFAERVGCGQPTLNAYEIGIRNMPGYKLVRIADELGVSLLHLLGRRGGQEYEEGFRAGCLSYQNHALEVLSAGYPEPPEPDAAADCAPESAERIGGQGA